MNSVRLIYSRLQFFRLLLVAFVLVVFSAFYDGFTRSAQATSWNDIFSSEPPIPEQNGGSRGDRNTFCPIAPLPLPANSGMGSSTPIVYSDRPTLIWQGATERVELRLRGTARPLWSHVISEADRLKETVALTDRATYQVTAPEPLQPEQRYEWRIYPPGTDYSIVRFQTASLEERNQISQDLNQITPEPPLTALIERADYFAGQQLWSDFWQTLFSGQPLSPDLAALNGNTIATLCPILSASSILSLPPDRPPQATHQFDGTANQTIELSLESPEANTQFTLLDPQGKEIGSGTAQPNRPVSQLFKLSAAGQYTVRLQAIDTPTQNQYTLVVMSRFNAQ